MSSEDISRILRDRKFELTRRFDVANMFLFGSFASGTSISTSDVDLVVRFEQGPTFQKLFELAEYLEEIFGRKVDLLTEGGLPPRLLKSISKNWIRVA